MFRADDLLAPLIRQLGLESGVALLRIRQSWDKIMGPHLAPHIAPAGLSNGELLITVDTPVRMQHLHFLSHEIVKKAAPFGVAAVRFRLGTIRKPAVRKHPETKKRELTAEDRKFIEEMTGRISDPDLRDSVRRAIEKSLERPSGP